MATSQSPNGAEAGGGDPKTSSIVLVAVVSTVVLFVVVLALETLFHRASDVYAAQANRGGFTAVDRTEAEQLQQISAYRWIDEEKGQVVIPIDRAMDLVVAELGDRATPAPAERGAVR
jgi:hypothetical protein